MFSSSRGKALGLALSLAFLAPFAHAEEEASAEEAKLESWRESYQSLTEDWNMQAGLWDLFLDEGSLYARLEPEALEAPFLVLPTVSHGLSIPPLLTGYMVGSDHWVIQFERVEDSIQVRRLNFRIVADEDSPMETARRTSFQDSVIAQLPIEGLDDEAYLVKLDSLFFQDHFGLAERLGEGTSMETGRARWTRTQAFPENLEIEFEVPFSGLAGTHLHVPQSGSPVVRIQLSVLELVEDEDFSPRLGDDRVGHFLTSLRNLSSQDPSARYLRYVQRWKLEKANPDRKSSPVKEPLVFHISRATPYEFRPYVRQAILEWNKAFAKVGLENAVEVRMQLDDEDFSSADARYHTIQWVADAPFNGVGPRRADPTTGKILDADILYNGAAIENFRKKHRAEGVRDPDAKDQLDPTRCEFQEVMAEELHLADLHLASSGSSSVPTSPTEVPFELLAAAVRKTVMHEVGHVLGLRHNFKSSSIVPRDKLHDKAYTQAKGLTGSIMDYPAANLAAPGEPQGEYFSSTLGPYDYWAIEYAYADPNDYDLDEDQEEEVEDDDEARAELVLAKIASKAPQPELAYGSDEDRSLGDFRDVDPLSNRWDLSDDPLGWSIERTEIAKSLFPGLAQRVVFPGEDYSSLRYSVRVLLGTMRRAGVVASKYIGGLYHHRDHKGDPGERPAFVPVPAKEQRRALRFFLDTLLADETYDFGPELLSKLSPPVYEQALSNGYGRRIHFPVHYYVEVVQRVFLDRVFHPMILTKLQDSLAQALPEGDALTLAEVFESISKSCFAELDSGKSKISSTRRRLQERLVSRWIQLASSQGRSQAHDGIALARAELEDLVPRLEKKAQNKELDILSRAHVRQLQRRIETVLATRRLAN